MADTPSREEIELRAHEIYLERDGQDGNEVEHWLSAEKELADCASRSDAWSSDSSLPSPNKSTAAAGTWQPAASRRVQE